VNRPTHFFQSLLIALFGCFAALAAIAQHVPVSNAQLASPALNQRVEALLRQMTLDEKVGQLAA